MKKLLAIAVLFFASQTISAQTAFDKWPAMKTFHEVMARVYHPVEDGNLGAVKDYAATLDKTAQDLSTKDIPAEFKTKQMMAGIAKLQEQTATLKKLVATHASDEDLKTAVTQAHETFHQLVGMCSGEKH
ncbi:MAG: hypothetical protein EOO48_08760 [Flavobacterium sp.]|nr:MAG: hypothetical protein EOO48_08760 [Flavobacterium sp.]